MVFLVQNTVSTGRSRWWKKRHQHLRPRLQLLHNGPRDKVLEEEENGPESDAVVPGYLRVHS